MQQNTTYLHLHFIANKHQHHRLEAVDFWFPIPSSVGTAVDVEQLDWDGKKFKKKIMNSSWFTFRKASHVVCLLIMVLQPVP